MTNEQRAAHIRALLAERRGYVLYNRPDRVKDVDDELRLLGYGAGAPATRAEKRPRGGTKPAMETR